MWAAPRPSALLRAGARLSATPLRCGPAGSLPSVGLATILAATCRYCCYQPGPSPFGTSRPPPLLPILTQTPTPAPGPPPVGRPASPPRPKRPPPRRLPRHLPQKAGRASGPPTRRPGPAPPRCCGPRPLPTTPDANPRAGRRAACQPPRYQPTPGSASAPIQTSRPSAGRRFHVLHSLRHAALRPFVAAFLRYSFPTLARLQSRRPFQRHPAPLPPAQQGPLRGVSSGGGPPHPLSSCPG